MERACHRSAHAPMQRTLKQNKYTYGKNLEMVWQERQNNPCHAETDWRGGHRHRTARCASWRSMDPRKDTRPENLHRIVWHEMVGGRIPARGGNHQVWRCRQRPSDRGV